MVTLLLRKLNIFTIYMFWMRKKGIRKTVIFYKNIRKRNGKLNKTNRPAQIPLTHDYSGSID